MNLKPLKWERVSPILETSYVMGVDYGIYLKGLDVECYSDGNIIYKGRCVDAAKERAQKDAQRRVEELME